MKVKDFRIALDAAFAKLQADNPTLDVGELEIVSWNRSNRALTPCNIDSMLRDLQQFLELIDTQLSIVDNLPQGYPHAQVVSLEI